MRAFSFLFFLVILSTHVFCQPFAVKFSEPIKEIPRTRILPSPDGGFVGMKREDKLAGLTGKYRRLITLVQYDKAMMPIQEVNLADRNISISRHFTEFKKIGNKHFLIYLEADDKYNIGDLKAVEVNPATLETSTPKTILSKGDIGFDLKRAGDLFEILIKSKISPDQLHFGFTILTSKGEFVVASFNGELEIVWVKHPSIPSGKIRFFEIEVDNNGNFYLPFKKDEEGFVAVFGEDFSKVLPLKFGVGRVEDICLLAQKTKPAVAVSGMYYGDTKNLAGVYKTSINIEEQSIGTISQAAFPASVVELYDVDGFANTKASKYGLQPGFLIRLVEMEDGVLNLIAEAKQYPAANGVLHSGAILNVSFREQSPIFTRLPKYNVVVGTYWDHYTAFSYGKKLVIFYNDNPVNLTKDITESPKLVNIEGNSVLVAAVIEPDGQVSRLLPFNLPGKYMAVAEHVQPIADKTLVVPVYGEKKKNMYASISFQ